MSSSLLPKYHPLPTREYDLEGCEDNLPDRRSKQSFFLQIISHVLTLLSYTAFVMLLPITYWICVRKLKPTDRIVIFRLGKLIGSRGPGRVLVFPWIDRVQKVDVSNSAFSVPPQQLITHDGGIVELGAEVQYAITDCVALVREVADHQDILRSLGKTVMVRLLVKRSVSQLLKEKNASAQEIQRELNGQVRKWGLDIRCVSLSEVKILKQPQASSAGMTGLETIIMDSMGLPPQSFPSPMEFARNAYQEMPRNNVREGLPKLPSQDLVALVEKAEQDVDAWLLCLQQLLQEDQEPMDPDVFGKYAIEILEERVVFLLHLSATDKTVIRIDRKPESRENSERHSNLDTELETEPDSPSDDTVPIISNRSPLEMDTVSLDTHNTSSAGEYDLPTDLDIEIQISSSDLAGVIKGSLPPLQGYLSERIQTKGDVRKLMFLDRIYNKTSKPGHPFDI